MFVQLKKICSQVRVFPVSLGKSPCPAESLGGTTAQTAHGAEVGGVSASPAQFPAHTTGGGTEVQRNIEQAARTGDIHCGVSPAQRPVHRVALPGPGEEGGTAGQQDVTLGPALQLRPDPGMAATARAN